MTGKMAQYTLHDICKPFVYYMYFILIFFLLHLICLYVFNKKEKKYKKEKILFSLAKQVGFCMQV